MPRPTGTPHAYRPGMDGVRAVAVLGVIAYHLGSERLPGGLLGVGVFFTLSGYLITSILVRTWAEHGSVRLPQFWLARARRLLPALVLVLAVTLAATAIVEPEAGAGRGWQALFALLYVANWGDILAGRDYFSATGELGPLDHLWSLAVEEQFYVLWPLLLLLLLRRTRGDRAASAAATVGLSAASFALLWMLAAPGFDNTRAYEGTDTRAGGLLLGAALALAWRGGIQAEPNARVPRWLDPVGFAGLAGILALMATMPDYTMALYRWGLLALTLATLAVVAAASQPGTLVARVLGVGPLRWVGERSYGIYLWHLPVIAFVPYDFLAHSPRLRMLLILAVTLGLSALSWTFVENPIRTRGFTAALTTGRLPAIAGTAAVLVGGTAALAVAPAIPSPEELPARAAAVLPERPPWWGLPVSVDPALWEAADAEPEPDPSLEGLTSCTSVLHIGDSTSLGMISETSLPDPADRLEAQYQRVGATEIRLDILGARSVVERYQDEPNAQDALQAALAEGFDGCVVIAMGINEAANVAVGGRTGIAERIDLMQALAGDRPTMWITVDTQRTSGPWAQAEMDKMNAALIEACRRYPRMRIYDWAAEAPVEWWGKDRIHFTPEGDRERARRIADALVNAFPAGGHDRYQCLVGSA